MLLRGSGGAPELSLAEGLQYHLFLSHTWATGQDQVALMKRRLLALMPGRGRTAEARQRSAPKIFRDVDDLQDTDALEGYAASSA